MRWDSFIRHEFFSLIFIISQKTCVQALSEYVKKNDGKTQNVRKYISDKKVPIYCISFHRWYGSAHTGTTAWTRDHYSPCFGCHNHIICKWTVDWVFITYSLMVQNHFLGFGLQENFQERFDGKRQVNG